MEKCISNIVYLKSWVNVVERFLGEEIRYIRNSYIFYKTAQSQLRKIRIISSPSNCIHVVSETLSRV